MPAIAAEPKSTKASEPSEQPSSVLTVAQITTLPSFKDLTPAQQTMVKEYFQNGQDKLAAARKAYDLPEDDKKSAKFVRTYFSNEPVCQVIDDALGFDEVTKLRRKLLRMIDSKTVTPAQVLAIHLALEAAGVVKPAPSVKLSPEVEELIDRRVREGVADGVEQAMQHVPNAGEIARRNFKPY